MISRLKARLKSRIQYHVRMWVEGEDVLYNGDPRRRAITSGPTHAPVRLLQYGRTDGEPVTIGKYAALHHHAQIFHGGLHRQDWVSIANVSWENGVVGLPEEGSPVSNGPVVIGNDVHIGWDAVIFSGVTVGDGAIVGARAVVMRDVEPYSIVLGNPARHVGYRFDEPTREALLRIKWWDWPDDVVAARIAELNSADVAGFIAKYDPGTGAGEDGVASV